MLPGPVSAGSTTTDYQCPTDPAGTVNIGGFDGQYCSLPLGIMTDKEYNTIQYHNNKLYKYQV